MGQSLRAHLRDQLNRLRMLALFLLAFGIVLRFVHLGQKVYWLDECFTSLHLSGYTDEAVRLQAVQGKVIQNQDFLRYQFPGEKTVGDTIERIALGAPELPPFYFVLARWWQQCFGNSVTVIRGFSAVVSLLTFPCLYWLCWELWQSPLTGWMAVALVAVSPFHLEMAQEARPYSVLIVLVLACHSALLRARRRKTKASWFFYAGSVVLGLYAHLLFSSVLVVHALYMCSTERRRRRRYLPYVASTCLGILLYLPWAVLALPNVPESQLDPPPNPPTDFNLVIFWIKGWVRGLSLIFVDFDLNDRSEWLKLVPFMIVLLLLMVLLLYGSYRIWRDESEQVRLFLGLSVIVPALALIVPNLLTGEVQSVTARYWWPAYLGIQVGMARFFVTRITARSSFATNSFSTPRLWQLALAGVLTVGGLSCLTFSASPFWWSKTDDRLIAQSAQVINAAQQPLVVSDAFFVRLFPLSHLLKSDVALQFFVAPNLRPIQGQGKTVFLYKPSSHLLQAAEKISPAVSVTQELWRWESGAKKVSVLH